MSDIGSLDILWRLLAELSPFGATGTTRWYLIWLDIAIVTALLYWLWTAIRGTRAIVIVQGVLVLVVLVAVFTLMSYFTTVQWLVSNVLKPVVVVAIPVVFQPELRRLLESVGQNQRVQHLVSRLSTWQKAEPVGFEPRRAMVREVARAVARMSDEQVGALIVFERSNSLDEYLNNETPRIDAPVSDVMLRQIFFPNSPLHDMAVLIRGTQIAYARMMLPLSEELGGVKRFGTRHRAARGITEQTDAVALVVSEET
ncbi:MAG: hypothetical protein RLZZ297_650, partial [Chloroflexota bacterium]